MSSASPRGVGPIQCLWGGAGALEGIHAGGAMGSHGPFVLRDFSLVFMEAPRVVAADFYIKNKCRPARPPRAARCAR